MAVVVTAVALTLAFQIRLNPSLFSLLPSDRPEVQRFFEITEKIGFQSLLISVIEVDPGVDQTAINEMIDLLAHEYAELPMIAKVEYRYEPDKLLDIFDTLLPYVPLMLAPDQIDQLAANLSDENIHIRIRENRQILLSLMGWGGKRILTTDPLGVTELFLERDDLPFQQKGVQKQPGLYRTMDDQTFFIFLTPTEPPQNISFSKTLMQSVKATEKFVLDEVQRHHDNLRSHTRIHHTGGYPIAVNDESMTRLDIKTTLITSCVCIMVLFFIAFRTPGILVLVGVPLVMSLVWTVGFAGLIFQQISILSAVFTCVLIGLGIDFAIHIVNRYFDPKMVTKDSSSRLEYTFQEAGTGILVGGLTTAFAFFAIGLSDFKGFQELGVLTGSGILFCLAVMLVLLPAMLVWLSTTGRLYEKTVIASFWLPSLLNMLNRFPKQALLLAGSMAVILLLFGLQISFDDNLKNFRTRNNQIFHLQDRVSDWLGGSSGAVLLAITGTSETDVMNQESLAVNALEPLIEDGVITKIIATSQLLPSPREQHQNLIRLHSTSNEFDPQRIKRSFKEALEHNGFKSGQQYDSYLNRLAKGFTRDTPVLPTELSTSALASILNRLCFQHEDQFTALIYLQPSRDLWSFMDTNHFKNRLVDSLSKEGVDPGTYAITGPNILTSELKLLILQNLKTSLILALASIIGLLLVYFRNLKLLLYSLLPLGFGMSLLVGLMFILDLNFNFLSIMVIPMIIGIGIDDGIHFANIFRNPGRPNPTKHMFTIGRAVVLTSLTTIAGFGSIILSHYPGLQSMGIVAVLGIAGCLFGSIILMPAIFRIYAR